MTLPDLSDAKRAFAQKLIVAFMSAGASRDDAEEIVNMGQYFEAAGRVFGDFPNGVRTMDDQAEVENFVRRMLGEKFFEREEQKRKKAQREQTRVYDAAAAARVFGSF